MEIEKITEYKNLWELLLLADPSRELVEGYIFKSEIFIAKDKASILGVCVLRKINFGEYEIMNIAVAPNHQRKGVGLKLINYVKSHIKG